MITVAKKIENTLKFFAIIKEPKSDENLAILSNLILEGIDIKKKDDTGRTPLHWAVAKNQPEIVQLLLKEGADIEAKDNDDYTPLLEAARSNHFSMVELLITNKANVLAKGGFEMTPLHWAARNNNLKIAGLLLNEGAGIDAKDIIDRTPLHEAVIYRHIEIVRLLLANKANTEAKDCLKVTPLHLATKHHAPGIIQLLLASKANTEAKDNLDETPLHWTSRNNNPEIIQQLLEHGADITAKRYDGINPLELASLRSLHVFENFLLIIINKIAAAGRFDCLQEDFYINFLKKPLKGDYKTWERKLAKAAKKESIDTPEGMINKILTYRRITGKCPRQILEIIERQYANTMTLLKAYSLTGGILLPNITDVPPPSAPSVNTQSPAPLVFMHTLRSGKTYSHDVPAERTRKRGQRTVSQHNDNRQKKTLKKPRR